MIKFTVFGCSHTNCITPTWADIINLEKDIEVVNLALAGRGNEFISQSIWKHLQNHDLSNDFVVVQWSYATRIFEFIKPGDGWKTYYKDVVQRSNNRLHTNVDYDWVYTNVDYNWLIEKRTAIQEYVDTFLSAKKLNYGYFYSDNRGNYKIDSKTISSEKLWATDENSYNFKKYKGFVNKGYDSHGNVLVHLERAEKVKKYFGLPKISKETNSKVLRLHEYLLNNPKPKEAKVNAILHS